MKTNRIAFREVLVLVASLGLGCSMFSNEKTVSLDKTPPAVQSSIVRTLGNQKPEKIVIENADGKQIYEVTYHVNGQEHSADFSPEGDLIEQEADVEVSSLPAAVSSAIMNKYPGAKIEEAADVTANGQRYYEAGVKLKDGTERELQVNADGIIRADKAEEAEGKEDSK